MQPPKPNFRPSPCPNGSKLFEPNGAGRLVIQWRVAGPAWQAALAAVKALEGRHFDPASRIWDCPDNLGNRQKLLEAGFSPVAAPAIGMPQAPGAKAQEAWEAPWKGVEVPDTGLPLRPYQVEGLQMLTYRNGSGGLFFDMGLGKSLTALAHLKINPQDRPALMITTATTKSQWPREAKKWNIHEPFVVLQGTKGDWIPPTAKMVYINWDILAYWEKAIMEWNPKVVVADEVQAVGNSSSKRTKAFRRICAGRKLLALSGTPMMSKPAQMWSIASILNPSLCGGKEWTFLNRYCAPKPGFGGRMTFTGASNVEELHEKVREFSIRKTKLQVLKDLPDRVYIPVMLECQPSEAYREAEARILSAQGVNAGMLQERLSTLTASAYDLKRDAVVSWITDFLEDSDEKLVVFAWHRSVIEHLSSVLGKSAVTVAGGVSGDQKAKAVERFLKDPTCRVFIGQTASAGVGLDGLQAICSNVVFVELCWSASLIDQAESRLHRMGQKDSVSVYHLLAPGTIDEVMEGVLEDRRKTSALILDGKDEMEPDENILAKIRAIRK